MKKTSKYNIREDIIPLSFHEQLDTNLFYKFQISNLPSITRTVQDAQCSFLSFEFVDMHLISRIIEKGKTPSFETCRLLFRLAGTCQDIYGIVNYHLLRCTESCLQDKLSRNVFSDLEFSFTEIKKEFLVDDAGEKIEHNMVFDPTKPIYYMNYMLLLFLSTKYSGSQICQQFQDIFDKWNFDVRSCEIQVYEIANAKDLHLQFHLNLVEQLIKQEFTFNSNLQLQIIKKTVFGCLNSPENRYTLRFGVESLFKKLIKNTTLWEGYEVRNKKGELLGYRDLDRFVEETRPISAESLNGIIDEFCDVLDGNDYTKVKKSLDLLLLLIRHNLLLPNSEYCQSILEKTVKWIQFEVHGGEFSSSICVFLSELLKKGIKKEFLSFLHPDFLDVEGNEGILTALAQHEILQKDSEFRNNLINKIIAKLNNKNRASWMTALEHLMILSDNKILNHYPMYHKEISTKSIHWLIFEKEAYTSPLLMIASLIQNDIFICKAKDIVPITRCSILNLRSDGIETYQQYYVKKLLFIFNKLLLNELLFPEYKSVSSSFHKDLNKLMEIIETNYICDDFRVSKKSKILFPEVLLKLQKLSQEASVEQEAPRQKVLLELEVLEQEIPLVQETPVEQKSFEQQIPLNQEVLLEEESKELTFEQFEAFTSMPAILVYLVLIAHLYTTFYN